MNRPIQWLLAPALLFAAPNALIGQTFRPDTAVHEVKCRSFLGLFEKCVTIQTARLHWTFTRQKLGYYLFGRPWATAAHCTRVDPTAAKCRESVFISTDREWNRLIWGQANTFLRIYGTPGTPADGPGHLARPLGADITRREGEWHVGFIADSHNNRIVVLAVGYSCKCVRWLGTLDGSESGTPLGEPHDVAWDPAGTWSFADDRVFIADTDNHRILVYQVSANPAAGTMTKRYVSSFGAAGVGPGQFSRPQGISVRSWKSGIFLLADVHVADAGNERISLWYYDTELSTSPAFPTSSAAQSARIGGSDFVGLTRDYYGDVLVADKARDVVVKFTSGLQNLTTYGGTPSWSTGNFNDPTDVAVIPHYWQYGDGSLVREKLPYVQSVEQWTATTGGQLHHLGIDAAELTVTPGQCDATFTFLLTAYGDYTLKVRNHYGGVITSWTRTGVSSGRKSEYWNAQGQTADVYSYVVEHRSAYGDDVVRTSVGPSFLLNCFTVTANAPGGVSEGGTYPLYGSSNHPSDSWKWEQNGTLWATAQNSSFYVPHDPGAQYTIDWTLTARRTSDGLWDSGAASTYVSIPSDEPPPPPPPECPPTCDQAPPVRNDTTRVVLRQAGPPRRNHHVGSGAWIGARTTTGPRVTQLFSPAGLPVTGDAGWPNALAGEAQAAPQPFRAPGTPLGRAAFSRRVLGQGADAYRARFLLAATQLTGTSVGIALDPELGTRPGDEVLGWDPESKLAWVEDPDSGVVAYRLTDVPQGAAVTIRQFSTRADAWHPAPIGDSAAYAEISAREATLTAKPGDVRFLIAIGPVSGDAKVVDVGFVMLTAPTLAALRERVASTPQSVLSLFANDSVPAAGPTGITRFHLTQAPPEPAAPSGVRAISPALVPGLAPAEPGAEAALNSERVALRDAIRRHGITALAFAVPDGAPTQVTVRLYDPASRLVRTLVNETYEPGAYRVQWDLNDQRGARVAPGVYIAVMEAQGFRGMTRLVVVP